MSDAEGTLPSADDKAVVAASASADVPEMATVRGGSTPSFPVLPFSAEPEDESESVLSSNAAADIRRFAAAAAAASYKARVRFLFFDLPMMTKYNIEYCMILLQYSTSTLQH